MYKNFTVLNVAGLMARHASARQTVVANNIANADTPGFKAKTVASFSGWMAETNSPFNMKSTRKQHLASRTEQKLPVAVSDPNAKSEPNGNSVSLEMQTLTAVDVKRQHDKALAIYKSGLSILRSSLGRR